MRKSTLGAVVAAGLMAGGLSTSASAADFGGNCCADLEERIAELEATTVRKGNRKVSLTISGFVAQQIMYWDDGFESNTYITDTGSVSIGTHVAFTGQATIAPGWTAGYVLKVELMNNDSLGVSQNNDDGGNVFAGAGNSVGIESSYWFIKSDQLGRLSVGQQSSAADNQAILPDGSGSLVQANYVLYDVLSFGLRNSGGGFIGAFRWADLAACRTNGPGVNADCDGYPGNHVRWDSPTFAGFSVSASWGEDDNWAVSGRYAGELGGFKLAAAAAYNVNNDYGPPGPGADQEAAALQVGAYIQHIASGLFVYGAWSEDYIEENFTAGTPEGDMWYVKAGIRQRWASLGHTVLFGFYGESDDKMTSSETAAPNDFYAIGVSSSELEQYGLGVVQEVDAAAMSFWLVWKHFEADVTCGGAGNACVANGLAVGNNTLEELDIIKAGALINF